MQPWTIEYQSPMIEVEGKINNDPIAILIDSGASHSFIRSNFIEIFHLTMGGKE
jgi:hypothetical protein